MPLFKTCRCCAQPSLDASYRDQHFMVLCAACNSDLSSLAEDERRPPEPETRVWTPRETGVLKYNPFRPGLQGGGSR